ncbi:MAG: alpha,alpha-trehalose-phosphate synthase (UDP-forming) [Anaerolineae bacterium]
MEKRSSDTETTLQSYCTALPEDFFENRALIIASNRGPVTFNLTEERELTFERGSGGLVTALTGIAQYVNATWIACAQSGADAQWRAGEVPLWEGGETIRVEFLSPSPSAYDGYYSTIANPLLWFLQHSMWDLPRAPIIDRTTWDAWEKGYKAVNEKFAEAIVARVRALDRPALVMLQDYHLYLVPRMIWSAMRPAERPTLLHFIHIPWPGPEYWRILPPTMREEILDSLCAVDVLGLQTQSDALNFLRTCHVHLPTDRRRGVKYGKRRVWYRNHHTYVRDFPISIDVEALREMATTPEVASYRRELHELLGEGYRLIVRIERTEPSKNIIRGFRAFAELLKLHPEHRKRVKFLALLVPSRLGVDEYQNYLDELMAAAGRVNAEYGTSDWEPVRVLVGENYPRAVAALQMYDVLLVNAIADGMNLVAKEGPIVNERDGVLVLSESTGARQQLGDGAKVISPCDVYATAQALHEALTMPPAERKARAALMRETVEREDIIAWFCDQLKTIHQLKL